VSTFHQRQDLQCRNQAIPGRVMIQKNEMAGLLSSEVIAFGRHPFEQVPITNGSPRERDAGLYHRKFQSKITHDGPYHRLLRQLPLTVRIESQHRHNMITVYNPALFADEDCPISITV